MPKKKTNKLAPGDIRIDKSLNKYQDQNLFPEKLAEANRFLKTYGLPKELQKDNNSKKS
jgi:hypothetical protein